MKVKINGTKFSLGFSKNMVVTIVPALNPRYDYKFIVNKRMYYCNEEDILEYVMEFDEKEFEL